MKIFIILLFILKLTNCQNEDDDDTDYDTNFIDIEEKINCTV